MRRELGWLVLVLIVAAASAGLYRRSEELPQGPTTPRPRVSASPQPSQGTLSNPSIHGLTPGMSAEAVRQMCGAPLRIEQVELNSETHELWIYSNVYAPLIAVAVNRSTERVIYVYGDDLRLFGTTGWTSEKLCDEKRLPRLAFYERSIGDVDEYNAKYDAGPFVLYVQGSSLIDHYFLTAQAVKRWDNDLKAHHDVRWRAVIP